jgi:hypothetical protein
LNWSHNHLAILIAILIVINGRASIPSADIIWSKSNPLLKRPIIISAISHPSCNKYFIISSKLNPCWLSFSTNLSIASPIPPPGIGIPGLGSGIPIANSLCICRLGSELGKKDKFRKGEGFNVNLVHLLYNPMTKL